MKLQLIQCARFFRFLASRSSRLHVSLFCLDRDNKKTGVSCTVCCLLSHTTGALGGTTNYSVLHYGTHSCCSVELPRVESNYRSTTVRHHHLLDAWILDSCFLYQYIIYILIYFYKDKKQQNLTK